MHNATLTLNKTKRKTLMREIIFFASITGIPLLQFCIFYIGVNINSIMLSFKSYDAFSNTYSWVGFYNFKRFFVTWKTDTLFNQAISNSLIAWAITFGVGTILGLIFAFQGGYNISTYALRDGYFILDQDINYNGQSFFMFAGKALDTNNGTWKLPAGAGTYDEWHGDAIESYGWAGVLDGRGHKITNVKTGYGGMFGHLSMHSTIKNLGVECIEITSRVTGVLASFHLGLIDNVYVELE